MRWTTVFILCALVGCSDSSEKNDDAATSGDGGTTQCGDCVVGARTCEGDGFRICEKQASNCGGWSDLKTCDGGKICSGGQCVTTCLNQCSENSVQCASSNGITTCKKMTSGCTDWDTPNPCSGGKICSGGACVDSCINQCTRGAMQCSGNGVAYCVLMASDCTDWDKPIPCPTNEYCSGSKCVKTCVNQCTDGAKQCAGSGISTCKKMASGCTDWDTPAPCPSGEFCSGATCVKSCKDQCTVNNTQCSGTNISTCIKMPSNCTDWDTPVPCPTNQVCSGGKCVKACTNQCTLNATKCSTQSVPGFTGNLMVQTCIKLPTGCTDWDIPAPCKGSPNYACDKDKCVPWG